MSQFNEHLKLRTSLLTACTSLETQMAVFIYICHRAIGIPVLTLAPLFDLGKGSGIEACVRDCPLLNPYQHTKDCSYQRCCWFEIKYFLLEAKVHIIFLNCYINLLVLSLKYLMVLYSLEDVSLPCLVFSKFTSCI